MTFPQSSEKILGHSKSAGCICRMLIYNQRNIKDIKQQILGMLLVRGLSKWGCNSTESMWVYGYRCKGQPVRAMAPCLHPIAIPTGPPKYTHAYLNYSPLKLTSESANHHFQLHPVIQTHANKHAVLQGAAKEAWTNNVPGWKWRIRQLQRDVVEMRWIYREPLTMYLHMYGHLCVLIPTYIYIYHYKLYALIPAAMNK